MDPQSLCDEPITAAVADIFNVAYEVMLQVLARYFGHGHETLEEAQVLADTAEALMRGVLLPVGQLLTRMAAYRDRPGVNAGPAFELFYDSDYLLPHKRAAWFLISQRLGDLESFAGRLSENPQAPPEIASVRGAVLRAAARLADHPASADPRTSIDSVDGGPPGPDQPLSFARHISGLFRPSDRSSMRFVFDLGAYADVAANSDTILARLRNGSMPCDGAWPEEKIALFARWVQTGMAA